MDLTLRQELERIAEQEKTSFSSLVSAICDSYLKTVKPQPKKETEQEPATEVPAHDQKYLNDLKRQWPTLSQEQREAHMRIITRSYGPAGQDFLQHLGDKP